MKKIKKKPTVHKKQQYTIHNSTQSTTKDRAKPTLLKKRGRLNIFTTFI